MLNNILQYLVVLIVFLIIDFIWLALIARKLYKKHLGYLMAKKTNFLAAFVFYAIFVLGILVFVINPALKDGSFVYALGFGSLFGLVTYATYDLTNLATIKDWPIKITIIDLIWGTFVSAATSTISYIIISAIW
jgi:uncharacterized membrane protein